MSPSRALQSVGTPPHDLPDLIRLEANLKSATTRAIQDKQNILTVLLAVESRLMSLTTDAALLAGSGQLEEANKLYRIAGSMISEFSDLVLDYIRTAESVSKPQLPKDLFSGKYRDPWRNSRQHAARFANKWLPTAIAASIQS